MRPPHLSASVHAFSFIAKVIVVNFSFTQRVPCALPILLLLCTPSISSPNSLLLISMHRKSAPGSVFLCRVYTGRYISMGCHTKKVISFCGLVFEVRVTPFVRVNLLFSTHQKPVAPCFACIAGAYSFSYAVQYLTRHIITILPGPFPRTFPHIV